jgi:TRAP-type C4-dicarboxylate transport system substrate-binding protein
MNRAAFTVLVLAAFAAAAQVAQAAEPVQLKFANPGTPQSPLMLRIFMPFAERVTKASGGEVEIKFFSGPTLATYANVYDRVLNGVADLAFGLLGPTSAQFPKSTVTALPFEHKTSTAGNVAFWRLIQSGVVADEWQAVKVVSPMVFPPLGLHARKPIAVLNDMRGTKISAQTRPTAEGIERLGGTPITMPVSELYSSLQRGIIEVAATGWAAALAYKLPEVATYHVQVPLGGELTYFVMSKESYARLPAKAKAAFDAEIGEGLARKVGEILDGVDAENRTATAAAPGQSVTSLAPEEEARWKERVAPVTEAWVKATPDGARVLAAFRTEVARVSAGQ